MLLKKAKFTVIYSKTTQANYTNDNGVFYVFNYAQIHCVKVNLVCLLNQLLDISGLVYKNLKNVYF